MTGQRSNLYAADGVLLMVCNSAWGGYAQQWDV